MIIPQFTGHNFAMVVIDQPFLTLSPFIFKYSFRVFFLFILVPFLTLKTGFSAGAIRILSKVETFQQI